MYDLPLKIFLVLLAKYKNSVYCVATQQLFLRKTQCLDVMASGSVRTAPEPPVRLSLSALQMLTE